MKKLICIFLSIFILFGTISPICLAGEEDYNYTFTEEELEKKFAEDQQQEKEKKHEGKNSRQFVEDNPVNLLNTIYGEANRDSSEQVQNTDLDFVNSSSCSEVPNGSTYTISRTLCNLKKLSKDYIQYIMYIGLTAASILIIRNGFKIVTSSDREKQISTFKKNLTYIVIGVVLLIGFYYIIDLFVSMVNLVLEKNG